MRLIWRTAKIPQVKWFYYLHCRTFGDPQLPLLSAADDHAAALLLTGRDIGAVRRHHPRVKAGRTQQDPAVQQILLG